MNLILLKKLEPIFNKVGKKHGITIQEGKFIATHMFEKVRDSLNDPRAPKVMTPLGTFYPSITSIEKVIKNFLTMSKIKPEYGDKNKIEKRVFYYFQIWNRLRREKNKEITHWEWNRKSKLKKMTAIQRLLKMARRRKRK